MVIFNLLWALVLNFAIAAEAPLILTQKKVAELVLKQSLKAEEINVSVEQSRIDLVEAQSAYDFSLSAETGYQLSKYQNILGTQNIKDESYLTSVELRKPFSTGTAVAFSFSRTSLRPEFSASATTTYPNTTTDILGLTVEQSLWRNYFGSESRAKLSAVEKTHAAKLIGRLDQQQDLVLEGIALFWKTYVAQENFKESVNSRERYAKLVQAVRKKSGFGYTAAGELAQTQAELEQREQNVKRNSVAYLQSLDQLLTLLNLPTATEVKFEVTEAIPALPKTAEVQIENLRKLKAARLSRDAAKDLELAANSATGADLSLVGKMYSQGLEDTAQGAWGEALGGKYPQYYVGMKLEYQFGSGLQSETKLNRSLQSQLAENKLRQTNSELKDKGSHLVRQMQAAYAIALSSRTQKELREKAAQELNRSYNQGRTDISRLIEALNAYFVSEIAYSSAVGEYQLALNQWSAFNELLVTESKHEK
jgi:outer membrane protein TolC